MLEVPAFVCAEAPFWRHLSHAGEKPAKAAGLLFTIAALGFGGCAQQPQQVAQGHSKEYFPSSIYGTASRRVVENGPVPHGGGQYLVGKPYVVAGQRYVPSEKKLVQVGYASWYGDAFHGRLTANGEIYDRDSFTAAHPTMPLPSYARVTNLRTNASMIVRVNDRGPFASNRVMDVSRRVAEALDFKRSGTARIKVEYVGRASLAGSDDSKLYATLRQNGPAQWNEGEPIMTAQAEPVRPAPREPERRFSEAPARVAVAPVAPPPPLERAAPAPRPAPVWRQAAAGPVQLREPVTPREELLPRQEWQPREDLPRPVHQRPVSAAPPRNEPPIQTSRASRAPVLHWQQGPQGKPLSPLAWAQPKPSATPNPRPSHIGLRPSNIDLARIPGAGVPVAANPHPLHLARVHTGD